MIKRSGKANDVEDALYKWFVDVRLRDMPVTSTVLEEKANSLPGLLGNTEFIAINGWLCRCESRHDIKFKKLHSEKKDADTDSAEQWSSTVLTQILDRYEPAIFAMWTKLASAREHSQMVCSHSSQIH